ncbi:MAG TPA: hypothetical protein VJ848_06025 [Candidatus Angelobacter sp.]|nr:hypothetical protein [Candidatus Angelobacter sp.]
MPRLKSASDQAIEIFKSKLAAHKQYIKIHGEDMPEITNWRWDA